MARRKPALKLVEEAPQPVKLVLTMEDARRMSGPAAPFCADNSVDEIECAHLIQRLDGDEQCRFMHEAFRVLKIGGQLKIITPQWNTGRFWRDPRNKRPFPDEAALLYNKGTRKQHGIEDTSLTADFDFNITYTFADPNIVNRSEAARAWMLRHYANAIVDVVIVFTKNAPFGPADLPS